MKKQEEIALLLLLRHKFNLKDFEVWCARTKVSRLTFYSIN